MFANELDDARTHATHCCLRHGCKYGDDTCPVEKGTVTQEYACHFCPDQALVDYANSVVLSASAGAYDEDDEYDKEEVEDAYRTLADADWLLAQGFSL